jgi:ribosomal protein S18 acetylase RimI-like enzyme
MAALTTRPYQPGDASTLTDLMNQIEEDGGGRAAFTHDDTSALVKAVVADPATDTRLTFDGDGRLVAAGLVSTPPAGGFRVDMMGGVHPDQRGQGLGRELLSWQYERATQIHAAQAPDAQWQAELGVLLGEESAPRLYARHGFAAVRYFFDMVADTSAANADAALPDGLSVVEPYAELWHDLFEAHMEAFTDHWGFQRGTFERFRTLVLENETFRPELSRIALDGDQIAGYVLGYQDADPERLYIGQIGTRRPWRGQGLASALIAEVLVAAAKAGLGKAGLGVDAANPTGAVGVYERAGFVKEHSFVAYRRPIGG